VIIAGGHPFAHFAKGWEFSEGSMQLLRVHVGAQDGVDASLVAALLPKPAEQVGMFPQP
jgi:hypothetical protein